MSISPTADVGIDVKSNGASNPKLLVGLKEAARMLDVSERKAWQLQADGEIESFKIGRSLKFPVKGLEEYVESKIREASNE